VLSDGVRLVRGRSRGASSGGAAAFSGNRSAVTERSGFST
jgi:hypothetical protein